MGSKRVGGSAGPAWKRQRGTGVKSKIGTIIAALQEPGLSSEANDATRAMLAEGAQSAFAAAVEDRHPMQETVATYIKEVISDIAQRLAVVAAEGRQAVATADSELELHKAQSQVALDELEEAKARIVAKSGALDGASFTLGECLQAIASSDAEQLAHASERDKLDKEQSKFKAEEEEELKAFLDQGPAVGGSEKEAKKAMEKLMKEFGKLGAEPALLAAAPPVLFKTPEERAGFDSHVLDSLKALLTQRLGDVAQQLQANAAAAAALVPDATAKAAAGEQATAARDLAAAELEAAEKTAGDKQVALVTAQTNLENSELAAEAKREVVASADKEVEAFGEVVAILEFLVSRSSAPAPVEEAPVVEAAPEAPVAEVAPEVPAPAAE